MPIIDYDKAAKTAERTFFERDDISKENQTIIKDYLAQYEVKAATINKFLRHIPLLLKRTTNLETDMHDKKKINLIFKEIRDNESAGYYSTVVNTSKALARWLNDGELPKGFKDIKYVPKKEGLRDLSKEDMWVWEDGLKCAKYSKSVQVAAALLMQLDAGLRPSEFIDLNYGDIERQGDMLIVTIKGGKTGKREIPCQRCTPYVLRWLEVHPTQDKKDPLWVMENIAKSHRKGTNAKGVTRYDYWAIRKRVRDLAKRNGITKPMDFYNLRHSSCYLDKIDNLPLDLAAKRHGHTVEHFVEVYGRLDITDEINRMRKHYNLNDDEEEAKKNKPLLPITCSRCETLNPPGIDECSKCKGPLTITKALEQKTDIKSELDDFRQEMKEHFKKEAIAEIKAELGMK